MIYFLSYFVVLFCIFYLRNITTYLYTRKCFRLIKADKIIKNRFLIKINDEKIENPRISLLGVLYFYVIIPPEVPAKFVDNFLDSHFGIVNDMFLTLDLAGAVKASRREFTSETEDKNYADGIVYKYVIKFQPTFWFGGFKKFILFFVIFLISWLFIYKYGVYEYVTWDNIKMVIYAVRDFFLDKN